MARDTDMERRALLKQSAIAAAGLSTSALPIPAWAGTQAPQARDRIVLGRSGLIVSRLAQGTGTFISTKEKPRP